MKKKKSKMKVLYVSDGRPASLQNLVKEYIEDPIQEPLQITEEEFNTFIELYKKIDDAIFTSGIDCYAWWIDDFSYDKINCITKKAPNIDYFMKKELLFVDPKNFDIKVKP